MRIGVFGNHAGLAHRLNAAGVALVGMDAPDGGPVQRIGKLEDFFETLEHPRLFVLDLPSGSDVDRVIDSSYVVMEPGDVVIGASPSYWGDTLGRFRRMRHRSLFYVDLAHLPAHGTVLVAGDRRGTDLALPLAERLAGSGGAVRCGEAGAAHYARMVHAGVTMAIEHAVSEATQLLEAYPNDADPGAIVERLWPERETASPAAAWLLEDAVRLHAVIPLLAQSVMLEMGAALDDHRSVEVPPRVGGFVHPDDVL